MLIFLFINLIKVYKAWLWSKLIWRLNKNRGCTYHMVGRWLHARKCYINGDLIRLPDWLTWTSRIVDWGRKDPHALKPCGWKDISFELLASKPCGSTHCLASMSFGEVSSFSELRNRFLVGDVLLQCKTSVENYKTFHRPNVLDLWSKMTYIFLRRE